METLAFTELELAMKSVNESSGRVIDSVVPDPDQRDFSGIIEDLQMTVSNRINSNTDLSKIDETFGNNTVEVSNLLVNERNFDRQTQTLHSTQLEKLEFFHY